LQAVESKDYNWFKLQFDSNAIGLSAKNAIKFEFGMDIFPDYLVWQR